jgi:pyruvate dehydrogenase E2 component (dihydrolipoamide acetyltransferase)
MEVEAGRDGYLAAIRVQAGIEVPVGEVVAIISETADTASPDPGAAAPSPPTARLLPDSAPGGPPLATAPGRVLASPKARALARRRGIDLATLAVEGSRPILAADVAAAAGTRPPTDPWAVDHALYGPVEAEEVSRFRRIAARNLAAARSIPAVTHHDRADVTELESLRAGLAGEAAARGVRLTALAFHVRALARALQAFPRFNASLSADGGTLWLKRYVAIGIAVDTPHGLMVPVLRDADRLDLWQTAREIATLAERARQRRTRPEDIGGAGMTLTNLGGIGGRGFTPIVNPPEVAILGLSRASTEPVWNGERFEPRLMLPLDLTYDHRVINGAEAARFTVHYARLLADPRLLMA